MVARVPDQICQLIAGREPRVCVLERRRTITVGSPDHYKLVDMGRDKLLGITLPPDVVPEVTDAYYLSLDGHYLVLSHQHHEPQGAHGCALPYRIDLNDPHSLTTEHYERLLSQVYLPLNINGFPA